MYLHTLGEISLTLTAMLYLSWFIPQLMLTFKCRDTSNISLWMHTLLVLGYMADIFYGYGMQMQLRYRVVTVVGLFTLAVEHFQFGRYNKWQKKSKIGFYALTVLLIILFGLLVYHTSFVLHSKECYNIFGFISCLCWFACMWPQFIKNIVKQSTQGFSSKSALMSLFCGVGDIVSAYGLAWSWPNKIGSMLILIPRVLLFMQYYYYKENKIIPREYAHAA